MILMFPMPFDFMHAIGESPSNEELCRAPALGRWFALSRLDGGLGERVAGDFCSDDNLLA